MYDVVTMGEMMARFMPLNNLRIEQASEFHVFYGGDESIVAASLARFGVPTAYITKLPDSAIGEAALMALRKQGVATENIVRGNGRLGINYYENGASIRPSRVIYDRKESAMAHASAVEFDFQNAFRDAKWFHMSGITPAISKKALLTTETALNMAKEMGLTVSFDLNYRSKLWTPKEARRAIKPLMQYVDVCIGNEEDVEKTLGLTPKNTNVTEASIDVDAYREVFENLHTTYGFSYVAGTLRESHSASDNGWSVILYDGTDMYRSRHYSLHLVDRGGGGAAFSAGLIYGLLQGWDPQTTTEYAGAASALKQTILGDFNLVDTKEVEEILNGNLSGRVQR